MRYLIPLGMGIFLLSQSLQAMLYLQGFSGVMLQPNSQYFHLVYGSTLSIRPSSSPLFASITYALRPRFSANGFSDQDEGYFFTLGKEIILGPHLRADASAGAGLQQGYLEEDHFHERRDYSLRGIATKADLVYSYQQASLSISHLCFLGIDNREQLRAHVGWPYNFFHLGVGVAL
jgi:hypothetical protein